MAQILNCTRDLESPTVGEVVFKRRMSLDQDRIFFNVDTLQLFKQDGSHVVLPEEDKINEYSWRFELDKTVSPEGEEINLDGEIPGIGSLGNLFENKLQPRIPMSKLQRSSKLSQQWFADMGFDLKWRQSWAEEMIRVSATWTYSVGVYDSDALSQQSVHFYSFLFLFDDSMDTAKTFEDSWGHEQSPEKWGETCRHFYEILDGTLTVDDIEDRENAPLFIPTCKTLAYFRELAIDLVGFTEAKYFLDALGEFIESTGLESMLNEKNGLSEVGYDLVRTKSVGAQLGIHLLCVLNNFKPSPSIRRTLIFKMLNDLFAIQSFLVNDLISWGKELKQETGSNTVLIRRKSMDYSNAYQSSLEKHRGAAADFEIAKKRAYDLYPNDKEFHKYIDILENHITGAIRYHADKKRYGVRRIQLVIDAE